MPRQAKNFILISLAFAMLITVLMQSACHKEKEKDKLFTKKFISAQEFINKVKGEWYVSEFSKGCEDIGIALVCDTTIMIWNDSVVQRFDYVEHYESPFWTWTQNAYALNDTALCTIPEIIDRMQYWTINAIGIDSTDLVLETADLCGKTNNWQISYSDYYYKCIDDYGIIDTYLCVNMNLFRGDTTYWLKDFSRPINYGGGAISFDLYLNQNNDGFYILSRP
jgi:hypothetical protein